jgi:hypothetical protein
LVLTQSDGCFFYQYLRRKQLFFAPAPVKYLVLDDLDDEDDRYAGGSRNNKPSDEFSLLTEQDQLDDDEDEVVI